MSENPTVLVFYMEILLPEITFQISELILKKA